jgi:hypothetical protein
MALSVADRGYVLETGHLVILPTRAPARGGKADEIQRRQRLAFDLAAPSPPLVGREGVAGMLRAHDDVVEIAHGAEQADVLEGATEALPGAPVGRQEAVEHIEEGGLAGTVGADQRVHGISAIVRSTWSPP